MSMMAAAQRPPQARGLVGEGPGELRLGSQPLDEGETGCSPGALLLGGDALPPAPAPLWSQTAWNRIFILPLTGCVDLVPGF